MFRLRVILAGLTQKQIQLIPRQFSPSRETAVRSGVFAAVEMKLEAARAGATGASRWPQK
jgi:hypothetical protein